MGFFGTYLFDGQRWMPHDIDKLPTIPQPWLLVDIHDSDVATIMCRPTGSGSGVAYLGVTPRNCFEDPGASAPTDVAREADALPAPSPPAPATGPAGPTGPPLPAPRGVSG